MRCKGCSCVFSPFGLPTKQSTTTNIGYRIRQRRQIGGKVNAAPLVGCPVAIVARMQFEFTEKTNVRTAFDCMHRRNKTGHSLVGGQRSAHRIWYARAQPFDTLLLVDSVVFVFFSLVVQGMPYEALSLSARRNSLNGNAIMGYVQLIWRKMRELIRFGSALRCVDAL